MHGKYVTDTNKSKDTVQAAVTVTVSADGKDALRALR